MNMLNCAEKISREEILKVENYLGVKFPEEYIAFIINSNGGRPELDMLYNFYDEISEQKNTSVIRRFFSVCVDESNQKNNIKLICNIMRKEKMIPFDMIPIADDPTGNIICISFNQDDYGTVYYLNHEFEDMDTGYLMKSKISDSFKKFMDSLYVDE